MESINIVHQVALIIILGILSQWVSWRLKFPSIILFSITGIVLGPLLDWINPSEDFGTLLPAIIKLAVAIILFEAGLNLRFHELKRAGRALWQLILVGLPLSFGFGYLVCRWVGGFSVTVSLLASAILVVTGPTVILPLIRRTKLEARTSLILKWEGIINDPIGVLLAVLVFEFLVLTGTLPLTQATFFHLAGAIAVAVLLGIAAGYLLKFLFEKGHAPEFLKLPIVFSTVLSVYVVANLMQEEIGLLAVTVLGMTMGNINMLIIYELRQFKEHITLILVSVVFIILTADTDLKAIANLDWRGVAFLVGFLFFVRPAAVWIATFGSGLKWQEKLFIGWIAPRGIVAASVAGFVGLELAERGYADAHLLSPLIFSVIFATVLLHGFSIQWLANKLGLATSHREGVLIVGSNAWSIGLARILSDSGLPVLLVDSSWHSLKGARLEGLPIHYGEILSENREAYLELSDLGYLLAATGNDAYNALVCNAFVSHFGRDKVYQLQVHESKEESKEVRSASRGRVAFNKDLLHEDWISRWFRGWRFKKTRLTKEFDYAKFLETNEGKLEPIMLIHEKGTVDFNFPESNASPKPGDTVISFSPEQNGAENTGNITGANSPKLPRD